MPSATTTQNNGRRPLLALDTSTRTVGLALYDGTQVLHENVWTSRVYHTVQLAPAIDEALKKSSLSADDLGALAIATGPGSFTGLRIGMALAKGFALARHLPLIGVATLDALAEAQPIQEIPLVAVLRAGRGRLAIGWYQAVRGSWKPVSDIELLTTNELAEHIKSPTLVCGELSSEDRFLLSDQCQESILASPARSLRRPGFLAEIAWRRWQRGQADDPASLAPIYLHYNQTIPG